MNYNCKTSLEFIDGKQAPAFCMTYLSFEDYMYRVYNYMVVPKLDVTSITKQDLIDHPEKFRPFVHSKSMGTAYSEEFFTSHLRYYNNKWMWCLDTNIPKDCTNCPEFLDYDIAYMEKYYPKLYKKVLSDNGLPETFSQLKKSGNRYNFPDLISEDDLESDSNEEYKNVQSVTTEKGSTSSNGKPHHPSMPITITPEHVNDDKLPEKITYVRKKVGDGFMFVAEDEQASKVTPGNNGKSVDAAEINYTYIPEPSDLKL